MPLLESLLLTHFVFIPLVLLPIALVVVDEMLILPNGLMKLTTKLSPLCVG